MRDLLRHNIEIENKIEWLEKSLKAILNCCDLKNTFMLSSDDTAFANDIKDIAKSSLDGEPTTADEYNDDFIKYHDTGDENVVYISDINKEIAQEWNRDKEERINKKKPK